MGNPATFWKEASKELVIVVVFYAVPRVVKHGSHMGCALLARH
jgi:TRAP-type C4-dicarboxylate transport system permease small subunit